MRGLAASTAALVAGLACATVPPPNAFWTDAWGEGPSALGGAPLPADGGSGSPPVPCFERAEDERRVLEVPVERVDYCFFDDGLLSVRAVSRDPAAASLLFERFCQKAGGEIESSGVDPELAYRTCESSQGGVRSTGLHSREAGGEMATVERMHEELAEAFEERAIDALRDAALDDLMRD